MQAVLERTGLHAGVPGEPAPGPDPALTAARLRVAVSRLARRLRPTSAAGSLTTTEVDMLIAAERRGPARMSDFASFCGLNPTMVSRMVPKLEQAGLLLRRPDADDKRASTVEATRKAHKLLEKVRSERDDALASLLAELSEEELRAIAMSVPALEKVVELLAAQVSPSREQQ